MCRCVTAPILRAAQDTIRRVRASLVVVPATDAAAAARRRGQGGSAPRSGVAALLASEVAAKVVVDRSVLIVSAEESGSAAERAGGVTALRVMFQQLYAMAPSADEPSAHAGRGFGVDARVAGLEVMLGAQRAGRGWWSSPCLRPLDTTGLVVVPIAAASPVTLGVEVSSVDVDVSPRHVAVLAAFGRTLAHVLGTQAAGPNPPSPLSPSPRSESAAGSASPTSATSAASTARAPAPQLELDDRVREMLVSSVAATIVEEGIRVTGLPQAHRAQDRGEPVVRRHTQCRSYSMRLSPGQGRRKAVLGGR